MILVSQTRRRRGQQAGSRWRRAAGEASPNLSHPDFSQRSHWWRAPQITSDELACRVWFGSLCARMCVSWVWQPDMFQEMAWRQQRLSCHHKRRRWKKKGKKENWLYFWRLSSIKDPDTGWKPAVSRLIVLQTLPYGTTITVWCHHLTTPCLAPSGPDKMS